MMNRYIPSQKKSVLSRALTSESFLEKAILLVITATLSGFLIPYVTDEIQRSKARNEVILAAQSKLLEDISKTLLCYETLLLDVSWFQTPQGYNVLMHEEAFQRYSARAVDLLAEWRVESVKARTLVSPSASSKLDTFQMRMFKFQDTPMNILHRKHAGQNEWTKLHSVNAKMLDESGKLINQLATEMKITKKNID